MTVRKYFNEAVREHRNALGYFVQVTEGSSDAHFLDAADKHRDLITRLANAGAVITPNWLGQALTRAALDIPLGTSTTGPLAVKVADCVLSEGVSFPAVVNLLGTGHFVIDGDVRSELVGGILRSVLLRLIATRQAESLLVSLVDTTNRDLFAPFMSLIDAGIASSLARSTQDIERVLVDVGAMLEQTQRREHHTDVPERLIVIADNSGTMSRRVAALAAEAARSRIHFVIAGTGSVPMEHSTHSLVEAGKLHIAGVPVPGNPGLGPDNDVIETVCGRVSAEALKWRIP